MEEENWNSKKGNYKIFRVAIQLTDYNETESSIILFPGSHIRENKFFRIKVNLYNFIKSKLRKIKIDNFFPINILFYNYINIKNLKGDLWNSIVYSKDLFEYLSGKQFITYAAYGIEIHNNDNNNNNKGPMTIREFSLYGARDVLGI